MAMSKGIPPLADYRPEIDIDGGGQVQPQVLQYALRLGLELGVDAYVRDGARRHHFPPMRKVQPHCMSFGVGDARRPALTAAAYARIRGTRAEPRNSGTAVVGPRVNGVILVRFW